MLATEWGQNDFTPAATSQGMCSQGVCNMSPSSGCTFSMERVPPFELGTTDLSPSLAVQVNGIEGGVAAQRPWLQDLLCSADQQERMRPGRFKLWMQ